MKAAVFREVGKPLEIEDVEISKPGPREVLVRTVAAGVCHSDLHFVEGLYPAKLPIVLGHESAGIVEEVGEQVTYVKKGDHIITCLSAFCGECEYCLTGHMSLCDNPDLQRRADEEPRLAKGGAPMTQFANLSSYAEMMLVHEHALVKVREDMPLDRAALIGCGVMTGVGAVFHTAKVEPGMDVAIIGCGGVGLSAGQRRGHRRGRADHRHRHGRLQAQPRQGVRRNACHRRDRTGHGGRGAGDHRRRASTTPSSASASNRPPRTPSA